MLERWQEAPHMTKTLYDQMAEGRKLDADIETNLKGLGYGA